RGVVARPGGGRVFSKEEGLPGRNLRTGRAHLVGELDAMVDGADDLDGVLARAGLCSALTVPLRRGIQIMGALLLARRSAPYTLDNLEVASLMAAGVSSARDVPGLPGAGRRAWHPRCGPHQHRRRGGDGESRWRRAAGQPGGAGHAGRGPRAHEPGPD